MAIGFSLKIYLLFRDFFFLQNLLKATKVIIAYQNIDAILQLQKGIIYKEKKKNAKKTRFKIESSFAYTLDLFLCELVAIFN